MFGRVAARVITGPAAFLVGGVIDVLVYAATAARGRWIGSAERGSSSEGSQNLGEALAPL